MAGGEPRLGTTVTYMRHNDHGTTRLSTEIDRLHDLINDEYRVFSAGSVRKWSKFGLVARPWLRFHIPLIEPDMRISLHPALGQDLTPSPTARRAQAGSDARARRSRKGAGVDSCRPCFVWSCA